MTSLQIQAYISTALYRLSRCKSFLLPNENPELHNAIEQLISHLRDRVYYISEKTGITPDRSVVDPNMFSYPTGFISPLYGRVGKPEGVHLERYQIWVIEMKKSEVVCHVCSKPIFCLCSKEEKLPPERKTCLVSKVYPSLVWIDDKYLHLCSEKCDTYRFSIWEQKVISNYQLNGSPNPQWRADTFSSRARTRLSASTANKTTPSFRTAFLNMSTVGRF